MEARMSQVPGASAEPSQAEPLQDAATLAALRRRSLILAVVMLPAIVLTVLLVVSQSRSMRVADQAKEAIPAMLTSGKETWTSTAMTFSDVELEILETRDYMYRTYADGRGNPVDLCIIFSEDNRKGTHPPDVCLEGSGLRIMSRMNRVVQIAEPRREGSNESSGRAENGTLELRELVAMSTSGQYLYFAYFYKCGDTFTPSFYKQQWQIVWNGLTRRNASGALVRYSTPMNTSTDIDAARQRIDQLLAATFPYIRDGLN
jgi:EpsI family protein